MAYDIVNEENVYQCTGHPLRSDIESIVDWMLNKDYTTAYNSIPNQSINKLINHIGSLGSSL